LLTPLVALALSTAQPLRLSALLEDARQRNPELRAAQAQARSASSLVGPAGALDDPTLMVQYWNGPVDFSVVPIMVQLTQTFPLGGKLKARGDAAEADARTAQAEAAARLADLERDVTRLFVDLYVADRTLSIHEQVLGSLRTLGAVAASRVASGRAEVVDQLKAQAELLKEQAAHESLIADQAVARAQLAALLDREPSDLAGTPEELALADSTLPDEELVSRADQNRPELHAAASAIQAAEARVRLASASGAPELTPLVGYMHTFGLSGQNNFLFLGLQGTLPIWRGNKVDPAVTAARARVEASQELTRALRARIAAEVRSSSARLRAEVQLVEIQRRLVPISRSALDSALAGYAAGRVELLSVLDSAREWLMRQVELAQHQALAQQRKAELDRAVGTRSEVAR
jgi:outer membrane protein TolC